MIREVLGWVTVIGIILLVAIACWVAIAALISYSIQRYFELKEEFHFRMIGRGIPEQVTEQVH